MQWQRSFEVQRYRSCEACDIDDSMSSYTTTCTVLECSHSTQNAETKAVTSKMAYLVQLVGGPENRALPSGQDKMQHDPQLVCLAAVLPLPCSFKDSTCTCTAPSQLSVQSYIPSAGDGAGNC